MNILDHQEVLNHELRLLDLPGRALSSFYLYDPDSSAFMEPPSQVANMMARKLKIAQAKSCGTRVNSQFSLIACILMKIFFGAHKRTDLLDRLKCTLYSPSVPIDRITGMPARDLSSDVMKKILVQFFQVMQYHEGSPQLMLDKYPIVIEIFTLFFRSILSSMQIPNADHYNKNAHPSQTLPLMLDYFDISYQVNQEVYFLYEEQLALYVDERTGECFYGTIASGDSEEEGEEEQINKGQHLFEFEDLGKDQGALAPTPCFGELIEQQVNFNKKGNRKNSINENKLKMSAFQNKAKETMIQEANEEEQNDDKKRNSVQFRRNSEDICQRRVYYDFEDSAKGKGLDAIESPKISSPVDDLEFHNQMGMFDPKHTYQQTDSSKQKRYNKLQESTSKSDILKKSYNQQQKFRPPSHYVLPRANTEEDRKSIGSKVSCSCTQTKVKKNTLSSNVIDLLVQPNFSKKNFTPPTFLGKEDEKKQYSSIQPEKSNSKSQKKIPEFLVNRQNSKTQEQFNLTSSQRSIRKISARPPAAPRVSFTYNTKNQYIATEPSVRPFYESPYGPKEYSHPRQVWNQTADRRLMNLQRPPSYL